MPPPELLSRALTLSEKDRAELARQLILSLEPCDIDTDADAAWDAELERRAGEIDRGEVKLVDWRDAIQRIRGQLKSRGTR